MTDTLLAAYPYQITEIRLLPSKGGRFEVIIDDHLLYSKAATGRHAQEGEIEQALASFLAAR